MSAEYQRSRACNSILRGFLAVDTPLFTDEVRHIVMRSRGRMKEQSGCFGVGRLETVEVAKSEPLSNIRGEVEGEVGGESLLAEGLREKSAAMRSPDDMREAPRSGSNPVFEGRFALKRSSRVLAGQDRLQRAKIATDKPLSTRPSNTTLL